VTFRDATPEDVPLLLTLIRELAAFEREPHAVKMTQAELEDALFAPHPAAHAVVVDIDGAPAATAIWFESFNTWTGRPAMSVEDVYVREAFRGRGIGRALFAHLAAVAKAKNYLRMDWQVLDWNQPAIRFYDSLGAVPQSAWLKYRLSGEALDALASGAV
jgi:GNAT superfamily N-acetyltransferase